MSDNAVIVAVVAFLTLVPAGCTAAIRWANAYEANAKCEPARTEEETP